jgi:hypothetical protein
MSDGSSLMIKLKARDCQTLLFIPKTVETWKATTDGWSELDV